MKEMTVFKNEQFGEIRIIEKEGEPWFVLKDVCETFGETNYRRVSNRIDGDEKGVSQINTPGGNQNMTVVNEAGLYTVLFAMQPEKARGVSDERIRERQEKLRVFKRWITHEVIPAIRKHGMYATKETAERILGDPDFLIQTLETLKAERAERIRLEEQAKLDAPKVLFSDSVIASKNSILVGELAKLLKQNGVEIGRKRLFADLRERGYLMKYGDERNMPTQKAMENGWFEIKVSTIAQSDGSITTRKTPKVTGKGQVALVERYVSGRWSL